MNLTNGTLSLFGLNAEKARDNLPVVVYIGILSVIGFIGNLHVMIIYTITLKPSTNYRIFVLVLAIVDFIGSASVMPFEIYVLLNQYIFYNITACRIYAFIKPLVILGSGFMLFVIALERYLKICRPFGTQLTTTKAKIACIGTAAASILLSWPAPVIKGHATVDLIGGIQGIECNIQDKMKDSVLPVLYYAILLLFYFATSVCVVILYSLIGRKLHRLAKAKRLQLHYMVEIPQTLSRSTQETDVPASDVMPNSSQLEENQNKCNVTSRDSENTQIKKSKGNVWDKTTKIMFVVTLIFTVTFLPHLLLVPLLILSKTFKQSLGPVGWPVYKIFRRLFYLNNVANPFIYGLYDREFRNAFKKLYKNAGNFHKK